jgi:hypothetical protein
LASNLEGFLFNFVTDSMQVSFFGKETLAAAEHYKCTYVHAWRAMKTLFTLAQVIL